LAAFLGINTVRILPYNRSMLPYELIVKKRDEHTHTEQEIDFLVKGFTHGRIEEAQMASWLMAAFIRGLDCEETRYLTRSMVESGSTIDLSRLVGMAVDKHSTGGVGDKTTLVAGPLAAAAGVKVPKLSGRALGHTGGTLDKLATIPGFRTSLFQDELITQIEEIGLAVGAQTADIAPADKKLYALRDRTATVESIPFITASILSKKVAGGAKTILIDVKTGTGAFMPDLEQAKELKRSLVETGTELGLKVKCLVTDMNQPLGMAVGNSLEIAEAIETLQGRGPADLTELSLRLAAEMVLLGRIAFTMEEARERVESALKQGQGLVVLKKMIHAQGGDDGVIKDRRRLPAAAHVLSIAAEHDGYMAIKDCRAIGLGAAVLSGHRGGGFSFDAGAGILMRARHGQAVQAGTPLLELHYTKDERRAEAELLIRKGIAVVTEEPKMWPLVYEDED